MAAKRPVCAQVVLEARFEVVLGHRRKVELGRAFLAGHARGRVERESVGTEQMDASYMDAMTIAQAMAVIEPPQNASAAKIDATTRNFRFASATMVEATNTAMQARMNRRARMVMILFFRFQRR